MEREEEEERVMLAPQQSSRYWPFGQDVIKMHGTNAPVEFYMNKKIVKGATCEKLWDPATGRTHK